MEQSSTTKYAKPYMWAVILLGSLNLLYVVLNSTSAVFDLRFALLAIITLCFGSRIVIQIPRIKGRVSVSDTFILLAMLTFGGTPAILLAGADALCSSFRVTKKKLTIAFNVAVFICSTSATVCVLSYCFGSIENLSQPGYSSHFIAAISVMGFVMYIGNSGMVAIGVALKAGQPIWRMWKDNFLWTSLSYFAGASAAGLIAKLVGAFGIYAFIMTAPIILVVYFTYTTYLKNVEASAKQAEQAQGHVEELSRHIAEQERISRALKESEEHFRNAFDHAAGMALLLPDGHWLQVNVSLSNMLGYDEHELLATSFQSVTHPDDLGRDLVQIYKLLDGKISNYQMEKRYIHKDGHSVWVLQSASTIRDEQDKTLHLILQIQDITERKRAEDQIHHAAFHDALTGLPNRSLLSERLSMAIERAKRNSDYQFAILFLDLDRFKMVNDSLGHELGDKLLVNLSRRLEHCIRAVDMVARLGGDEFAILVDDIKDTNEPTHIALRIQESLSEPFDLSGHQFFTNASIGIALSSTGYERSEDILRDADTAMYRAKANGKARHEIFDVGMHTRAMEMLNMENDLRHSIEQDEIIPFYQPIISFETGRITGFEALARWQHPKRGLVSPADFIPLAEDTGLIVQLGISVLSQACKQLHTWQQLPGCSGLTMSVNLSGKQFKQPDLVEKVKEILIQSKIVPSTLRLEITETVIMENAVTAIDMLHQLKALDIKLSIDDFGTGYSSLSYLHRFPFDILKIDRSFVSRMNTERESRSIVKTIMTLANELGKDVVAEGIETNEQHRLLTDLACQYGQGYLFSKPLTFDKIEDLLIKDNVWKSSNDVLSNDPKINEVKATSAYTM